MLYLYFDEAYNLQPESENQFLLIGGFATKYPELLIKHFQRIKRYTLPKQWKPKEIKSSNRLFDKKLKRGVIKIFRQFRSHLFIISQDKDTLSYNYFTRHKFNYDKLYLDLLKRLLLYEIMFQGETEITVMLDNFTPQFIPKEDMKKTLQTEFNKICPDMSLEIDFGHSHQVTLLQVADFVCGIFYKIKTQTNTEFSLNDLSIKIIHNML